MHSKIGSHNITFHKLNNINSVKSVEKPRRTTRYYLSANLWQTDNTGFEEYSN